MPSVRGLRLAAAVATLAGCIGLTGTGADLAAPSAPSARAPDLGDLHHPVGSVRRLLAPGDTQDGDVPVATPGGLPRAEPAVAVDARHPNRIVIGMNDYDPASTPQADVYTSDDGGRSFHGPVTWPLLHGATFSGDPSLAAAPDGSIYFVFAQYGETGSRGAGGIFVVRSRDGGRTWTGRPTRIATSSLVPEGGRCHFQDKPEATVDARTGDVYVAWTDYNYDGTSFCGNGSNPAYLARSTDGGEHFVSRRASEMNEETVGAMPRVAPDGTVYVAYARYRAEGSCGPTSDIADMVVTVSTDHGRTFDRSRALAAACGPANPSTTGGTYRTASFPTFEVTPDGTVVLATMAQQDPGLQTGLVVTRSRDRGQTWHRSTAPQMSATAQYQFPRLAIGPRGRLALTYLEQQPGGLFSCLLASSADAGKTWGAPLTVSSELSFGTNAFFGGGYDGDYIGLAIGSDGVAHPAWTDIRTPAPDIGGENVWTRRVPL